MANGAVTQRAVEAIKPAARDQFLWDDKLAGFGLRCFKGTGRKTFVVQWKRDGRTRQMALGMHPIVKAEDARRRAVEILAAVGARPVLAELLPGSGRSLTAREPDVGITSPKPTAGEPEA